MGKRGGRDGSVAGMAVEYVSSSRALFKPCILFEPCILDKHQDEPFKLTLLFELLFELDILFNCTFYSSCTSRH
jgi:hypothetical protein